MAVYGRMVGYSREMEQLILICGLGTFLTSGKAIFQGIFRVQQRLDIPAKVELAATGLRAILVAGFLFSRSGLLCLVSIHALVATVVFLANAYCGMRAYRPTVVFGETLRRAKAAILFGCSNALYFGYSQLGIFLLASMAEPAVVGAYAAVYRIIVVANEFPIIVFQKTLLPLMFRSYKENQAELKRVYATSSKYMFGLGILLACGLFLTARSVVTLVYGKGYLAAVAPLKILACGLALRYLSCGAEAMLTAIDRLKEKVLVQLGTVVCFLILNVVLIPRFSLYGAAAASVASDVLMLGLYLWGTKAHRVGLSPLRDLRLDRLALTLVPLICIASVIPGRAGEYVSLCAAVMVLPFLLRATRFLDWRYANGQFSVRSENEP
jgi:O-antigen/teichoic acid export membrane protein